ncbi:MAG TPA: hypothetical protein VJM46_04615 [Candidatus Saccharimonadales bacterium]|nr:hypothetical protein [Candidatus Saccharimonadales bacterium]
MGIRVLSVTRRGGSLQIVFAEPFLNTDAGNRAFRVLFMHVRSGYGADDRTRTLDLGYAANITAINTRAALQAELDRYADVPIRVTFGKPEIGATGMMRTDPPIKTRAHIRAARAAGRQVWVQMKVTASMPVTDRDKRRMEKFVPGGIHRVDCDPCSYWVVVNMRNDQSTADPWRLVNRLKPQILATIV